MRDEQIGQKHQLNSQRHQGASAAGRPESRKAPFVIVVLRRVRISPDMTPLGRLAIDVDNPAMVVQQVRHEAIGIFGDESLLVIVGSEVVIDGIPIEDRVKVVDADIAVPAIARIGTATLVPLDRVTAVALVTGNRSVTFHVTVRQEAGLAGDFLQNSQCLENLARDGTNLWVFGDRVLIAEAAEIPPRPNAGVDNVPRFIDRVVEKSPVGPMRNDGDVQSVERMFGKQVVLEESRFFAKRASITDRMKLRRL